MFGRACIVIEMLLIFFAQYIQTELEILDQFGQQVTNILQDREITTTDEHEQLTEYANLFFHPDNVIPTNGFFEATTTFALFFTEIFILNLNKSFK